MKKITSVTVKYADGSTETINGDGHLRVTNTVQTVEYWPEDEPDRPKPKERHEDVRYITIALHPVESLTD